MCGVCVCMFHYFFGKCIFIILNNIFHVFQCFLTFVAYVTADIGLTAGQNQYLPPNSNNGYNYQKPNIPFGSAQAPQTVE